ncbi:MAG TPA: hypothetical protein VHM91_01830, partial [Verrucomicrobiales bacterium]|nr:hypothetical protein [Verrucomicrobiales bacterium]
MTLPVIPFQPSDQDIALARAFGRRLVALDGTDGAAADNAAFGEFLRRVRDMPADAKRAETEAWLKTHPHSRWATSLRAEVAGAKYKAGWFAEAREIYQGLWNDLRSREDEAARGLADEALGFLLDSDTGAGRFARLKELLAESAERPHADALESKLQRARQAVSLLEKGAMQSVTCGPLALNAIQRHQTGRVTPVPLENMPASYLATGIPLNEVAKYAVNHYHLPLTPAKRTDSAAAIPVPSVLHAREDHYLALVAAESGKYFVVDRARRFAEWVEATAVDAMSSGHFLVPSGKSAPAGFELLAENEARNVFGRDGALGIQPADESSGPARKETNSASSEGVPVYTFHAQLAGLIVKDRPLAYRPPFGPPVALSLTYQDMDSSQPVASPAYAHTGKIWMAGWTAYVEPVTGTLTASSQMRVHESHGGVEVTTYDVEAASFGPHDHSFAVIRKTASTTYERVLPDGTKEVYSVPDVPASPTKIFLSRIEDAAGNAMTFTWNGSLKLTSVKDALNQVTTLQYAHPTDAWKITSVTDPFSRTALLGYNASGRLNSLTNQAGMVSTPGYQTDGFMTSMATPYGTTLFRKLIDTPGFERITEAEDPLGNVERIQFVDPGPVINSLPPAKTLTIGSESIRFHAEYGRLQFRNSFYWTKEAWRNSPNDYSAAVNYRWMADADYLVGPVLEAVKPPLGERTWFAYPGAESTEVGLPFYPGMGVEPAMSLLMVDATTPQLSQTHRNRMGRIIKAVDPLGRTTEYKYHANGLDPVEIRQTTGGISERLSTLTYNSQRKPLTVTSASGQITTFTYNARGQRLTTASPQGTTTYGYNANGCLTSIDGPLAGTGDTTTYTYDAQCRVSGVTGPDGYAVTFAYDSLDRLTRRTFPDTTYEEITYNRLDPVSWRDRNGRVTSVLYDALRQPVKMTDPLNRVTLYEWGRCGEMGSLTDPMGRTTRWNYDLQGRPVSKDYPDGSRMAWTYHPSTGLMASQTDQKGQAAVFSHYLDGRLRSMAWPNALLPTPGVTYTYDSVYGRPATMTDGQGTTVHSYHPVTGGVTTGAGKLASIDGPWANDTITFTYDSTDRLVSRSINGVPETMVTDAADRVTSLTNSLGTFTPAYAGTTGRIISLGLPGGGQTLYTYYPNNGDRRLQTITHQAPGSVLLSEFAHTWDASGRLTGWTHKRGAAALETWALTNDAAGQLTGVSITQPGFPNRTLSWEYDPAGNRTAEIINGSRTDAQYDRLNQQTYVAGSTAASTYEWDGANRLTAIVRGTKRSEFSYGGH